MSEGSVDIDGFDAPAEEVDADTQNVNKQDSADTQPKPQGEEKGAPQNPPQAGNEPPKTDVQKTDKGTKLDPNPQSAFHQLLANEKARVREYEQFLSDPGQVRRYLEELEKESGTQPSGNELTPDRVQTVDDVQKYLAQLEKRVEEKVKGIETFGKGLQAQAMEERVNNGIRTGIDEVRSKYPELRPTNADGSPNPDFDPDIEQAVGQLFDRIDLDPTTGKYKGSISIVEIADFIMRSAKKGQDQGSRKAQTLVKDRRDGRVIAGTTTQTQPDESSLSASQIIASRMKRAAGR